ncbi:hypothetical protein BJX96DRAFT_172338 [Aspergillus floccosus]
MGLDKLDERTIARTMLIELLAYQFAFPVKWIETQHEFFTRNDPLQQYVEVGPAKVLSTMGKKTANKDKYKLQDQLRLLHREFLSYSDDYSRICYEYEESRSSPPIEPSQDTSAGPGIPEPQPAPKLEVIVQQPSQAVLIEDVPLRAQDVVVTLVGRKLKRGFDSIPGEKSLRDMAGGKSTLQNEVVGDLVAEFGSAPDGCEDLPLAAVGAALESNFSARPGKVTSSLISKLISSKLPPGWGQTAIRAHLETHWGLGPDRQTALLCFAVTSEPSARLETPQQAKDYLDGIVDRYSKYCGIKLSPGASPAGSSAAQSSMVDPKQIQSLRDEYQQSFRQLHQALSRTLGSQDDVILQKVAETEQLWREAASQLETWKSEFDDTFLSGITPKFDSRRARVYNSWWNWARVDMVAWTLQASALYTQEEMVFMEDPIRKFLNRMDTSCLEIVEYNTMAQLKGSRKRSRTAFLQRFLDNCRAPSHDKPLFHYRLPPMKPQIRLTPNGTVEYWESERSVDGKPDTYCALMKRGSQLQRPRGSNVPFIHLRRQNGTQWVYDEAMTSSLFTALGEATSRGLTFEKTTVLVTGAGPQSIGAEIVRGLLTGGARVIVTTSRSDYDFYRSLYREYCGRGSELIVFPFNQASKQDCEDLVAHLYEDALGPTEDIDCVIPFAAIPENGRQIDGLDSVSEVAHRAMLVNLLRLLGYIKAQKEQRSYAANPTHVILPLSPNHGTFGGDGLYSESKLGLETLFNRFKSESWSDYLTICGAVIGWTRGTGLMSANNIIAETIEAQDVVTFSSSEMALNILALLTPEIIRECENGPIYADLQGGMQNIADLKELASTARKKIQHQAKKLKAIAQENELQEAILFGLHPEAESPPPQRPLSNLEIGHPSLPDYETMTAGTQVPGDLIDLRRAIVVVGYSELGPWGSARTRWEMESSRQFTMEGYVEMAWIMGLVKHFSGDVNGSPYVGWIDSESGKQVHEADFEERYGAYIRKHAGLRFVEPELFDGYDPSKKEFLQEVVLEEDLPVFQASESAAHAFKLKHGDKVTVSPSSEHSNEFDIQFRSGARLLIPKSQPFDRLVAGQLPTGWDPKHYGIPDDIISQVDPITIYVLCCVSQAMLSAGIEDPYELYRHIHVSELANCIGTGAGGLLAMRGVYKDRYMERDIQGDILQESFANAMDAWVNMLLLGASGPIKSPSGTCATAIESLDIACEAIQSGKAKVALVGGTDDLQEEMSYEFANMKATANTVDELNRGRTPGEISRPTSSSRAGFVESAGCGVQILMSAELALEMGVPIYGIVAYSQMSGDRIGRSVPAPGKGVLTAARESASASISPLLDAGFRQRQFNEWAVHTRRWKILQLEQATRNGQLAPSQIEIIENAAASRIREEQNLWGLGLRQQNSNISPIRAALAVWNLDIDDLGVVSFHGTSTKANDLNESEVINTMMNHMGRSKGNPLCVVCQKHLTGHPKGAAGAWMLNGGLQILQSGVIPGNRNADNVDSSLRQFEHLVYPADSITVPDVKAFMLTSFGFGQKGGLAVIVAPRYIFAAIDPVRYDAYRVKASCRAESANRRFLDGLFTNSVFQPKETSAWAAEDESRVFLDPLARVSQRNDRYAFDPQNLHPSTSDTGSESSPSGRTAIDTPPSPVSEFSVDACQKWLEHTVSADGATYVGVDVESVLSVNIDNNIFLERNYTKAEQQYCHAAADPQQSFAGRWAAKEAVFKSLQLPSQGPGAPMKEIEILNCEGLPTVYLHGKAKELAKEKGINSVQVSISHSDGMAMGVAVATCSL